MRTFDVCQKIFGNKSLLRQLRRNVHKIPAYMFIIECDESQRMELSVALMEQRFREKHGTLLEKVCVYYGLGFDVPEKFHDHMVKKH